MLVIQYLLLTRNHISRSPSIGSLGSSRWMSAAYSKPSGSCAHSIDTIRWGCSTPTESTLPSPRHELAKAVLHRNRHTCYSDRTGQAHPDRNFGKASSWKSGVLPRQKVQIDHTLSKHNTNLYLSLLLGTQIRLCTRTSRTASDVIRSAHDVDIVHTGQDLQAVLVDRLPDVSISGLC
jgi:hypothetical protein